MYLYQSNRIEQLFAALCEVLKAPLRDPLAPEVIVVQNPGMARWLSQQLALHQGICAHTHFPLPATFIWQIFEDTLGALPDLKKFSRPVLLWRVLDLLESIMLLPDMESLRSYLEQDRDGSKAFQLASKITDLFDQYLVYRPKMVLEWERGKEDHWQAILWRALTQDQAVHRADILERFLQAAKQGSLDRENLAERVAFFGINTLAPAYLQVLEQLDRHLELHLFHFSPCRQAWDDILPERLLALKRQTWRRVGKRDLSTYYSSGNPLLASMGTLGQEFFSLLMQFQPLVEYDLYQSPGQSSLLSKIQGDILDLHDRRREQAQVLDLQDRSITFHCCHSPMREVQVLYDRLLDLFAADPSLEPRDILVAAPDISRYASAVRGVFGAATQDRRIPWSLADQSRRNEQPLIEGFLHILTLMNSPCTASDIMDLLENTAVSLRFGLKREDMVEIRTQIKAAGIRWGLDREQQREQGCASTQHTWAAGVNRLFLGYLMGPLEAPWQGIMPCGGFWGNAENWLGGVTDFVRRLQRLRRQMNRSHTATDWASLLMQVLADFFSSDQDKLLILQECLADFAAHCTEAGLSQPLSLAVIRRYFERILAEPQGRQAFLSGKVTFCNMVPLRSLPFKVIWLLGMNDGEYPRSQHPHAFDLMAEKPVLGDRNRRDDDRYLFLEAIHSARAYLGFSWVGKDQRDNSPRPPSVLLEELRDYINQGWTGAEGRKAAECLTVEYPLQPFSPACFDGSSGCISYQSNWLPQISSSAQVFSARPLPCPHPPPLDLQQMLRFWRHPVRFFLEQGLGLRTSCTQESLPESEVFAPNALEKYLFVQELLLRLRRGKSLKSPLYQRIASGQLPGGKFAGLLYQEMKEKAADLYENIQPLIQAPQEVAQLKLDLGPVALKGWLADLYQEGRITFRAADLKPYDILQLWIQHLVLLLVQPSQVAPRSIHIATDRIISFEEIPQPQKALTTFLQHYQQGMTLPLHFYPKTSYAWAAARSAAAAQNAARNAWYSGYNQGEGDDLAYALALKGQEPLDESFEALSMLFRPILEEMQSVTLRS